VTARDRPNGGASAAEDELAGVAAFVREVERLGLRSELEAICKKHGVLRLSNLYLRARTKHFARARAEAMLLFRERLRWSYPAIGQTFNRDHTTVINACQRAEHARIREQEDARRARNAT
jgi:chromosomal replication initiator protein